MTRAIRNILHGPLPEKWTSLADANLWRKVPYALLLVSLLVFGFVPRLLTEKINPDAQKIVDLANRQAGASASAVVSSASLLASDLAVAARGKAPGTAVVPVNVVVQNQ